MKRFFWAVWDISRLGLIGPGRVIRNRALRRYRGILARIVLSGLKVTVIVGIILMILSLTSQM